MSPQHPAVTPVARLYSLLVVVATLLCAWLTLSAVVLEATQRAAPSRSSVPIQPCETP